MNDTTTTTLSRVAIVAPEIRAFTGVIARGDEATESYTPGGVRWIDPEVFRPVQRLRANAARICRSTGTRFLSGWAVDIERVDAVKERLAPVLKEARECLDDLLASTEEKVRAWAIEHPEVQPYLGSVPSVDNLRERCGVYLSVYKIDNATADMAGVEDGVLAEIGELPRRVLEEIAQDVQTSWTDRGVATPKTIGVAERACEKLRALKFLGGNLSEAAGFVESALASIPKGRIEGADYARFASLMAALSDPAFMARVAKSMPVTTAAPQRMAVAQAGLAQPSHEGVTTQPSPVPVWML